MLPLKKDEYSKKEAASNGVKLKNLKSILKNIEKVKRGRRKTEDIGKAKRVNFNIVKCVKNILLNLWQDIF